MAIRAIATDSQDFNNPSTTGKPGRDERLDFKNEAGDTVFSIVSDADGTAALQGDGVDGLLDFYCTPKSNLLPILRRLFCIYKPRMVYEKQLFWSTRN